MERGHGEGKDSEGFGGVFLPSLTSPKRASWDLGCRGSGPVTYALLVHFQASAEPFFIGRSWISPGFQLHAGKATSLEIHGGWVANPSSRHFLFSVAEFSLSRGLVLVSQSHPG